MQDRLFNCTPFANKKELVVLLAHLSHQRDEFTPGNISYEEEIEGGRAMIVLSKYGEIYYRQNATHAQFFKFSISIPTDTFNETKIRVIDIVSSWKRLMSR